MDETNIFSVLSKILFDYMHPHLLVLVICYVELIKKMTHALLNDTQKDVCYPIISIILGLYFGQAVIKAPILITWTTVALASGGVLALKTWIKWIQNGNVNNNNRPK